MGENQERGKGRRAERQKGRREGGKEGGKRGEHLHKSRLYHLC